MNIIFVMIMIFLFAHIDETPIEQSKYFTSTCNLNILYYMRREIIITHSMKAMALTTEKQFK